MKSLTVILGSIIFFGHAYASCPLLNYKKAMMKASAEALLTDELFYNVNPNESLRLFIYPEKILDNKSESYKNEIKLTLSDSSGSVNTKNIVLKTNQACNDYDVVEPVMKTVDQNLSIESELIKGAFSYHLRQEQNIPENNHSGSHALKAMNLIDCNNGTYSINLYRTHHVGSGIARKMFTYLLKKDLSGVNIIQKTERPGGFIDSLCIEKDNGQINF